MLRPRTLLIVLSLAALLLASCASRQTDAMLNDVETYIQEHPDSALATIRAIDTTTLTTPRLRAHYALLHAMALDKNWIDTTDVNVVMPAVKYYDRHPAKNRRTKSWYYLGRIQENGGDFTPANISFLKAEKCADEKTDDYFKSLIYQSLSNTYSETYLNEAALKYSELSFEASSRIGDTLGMNASRYRMAQELNNLKRYSEADSLFRLLIECPTVSEHLQPQILSDYALFLVQNQGDYESAVRLFEESLIHSRSLRTQNHWGGYAYALLRMGDTDRANAIFRQLEAADNDKSLSHKTWRGRADAYLGNFASAYDHITLASEIQQTNVARVLRQSTLQAQITYLKEEQAELQQKDRKRKLLYAIALFALASGTALFIITKRRKMLQERESLLEYIQSLSADYEQSKDDRTTIRQQYITLCQTHFRQIGRFNEILYQYSNCGDASLYKELKKIVQNVRDNKKSQEEFEKILNDSLNNVMTHFRESFPNKKERYYQIASFLFAGFSASTISQIIYDYSKDNIHLAKFRLKKSIRESDSPYKEQFLSLLS